MAIDNDLSALLPKPPPPRPARREAAIELALRKFDGEPVPAAPPARPAPVRPDWWRPQIAVFASAVLVVLVSVPIWWSARDRSVMDGGPVAPRAVEDRPQAAPAPALRAPRDSTAPVPPTARAELEQGAPSADAVPRARPDEQALASPAPPPAAARAAPAPAVGEERIVVTGSRLARQDFNSSSPMVSVDEAILDNSSSGRPGSAHSCTVLDRRADLSACSAFADRDARGADGRAARHLENGLELAWRDELDDAIDAFDRAIRADPDLSVAYLNRGLAYQSKGDLRRALRDLDRAVARDPDGARGYYYRSLLHRARGNARRAEADARRAIELDPSYEALLR